MVVKSKYTMADNYPPGMSECDSNGINGNCGENCPVYEMGDCFLDIEERTYKNKSNISAIKFLEVNEANV